MKKNSLQNQPVVTDYLEYFGLHEDPFSTEPLPFYDGGDRRELFAELLHLCQFSSSILVVLGEEGVGKGSLKTALCEHFSDQDLISDIDLSALSSSGALVETIAVQLMIDDVDISDVNQAIGHIRTCIQDSEEDDALKIVLVQNADNLDADSLKVLLRLAAPGDQSPYRQLHLVMFASPAFAERLQQTDQNLLQIFSLAPLTVKEIKQYLRFRLDAVGFSGLFPFKDPDIQFLYDISKGVPAKFHDAAREILIEMAMPPPENKSIGLPVTHMAAVVVLLAGLLLIVFYQSGGSDEEGEPIAISVTENPVPASIEANNFPGAGVTADEDDQVAGLAETPQENSIDANKTPIMAAQNQSTTNQSITEVPALTPQAEQGRSISTDVATATIEKPKQTQDLITAGTAPKLAPSPPTPAGNAQSNEFREPNQSEDDIDALLAAAKQELIEENIPQPPESSLLETQQNHDLTADESALLGRAPQNYTLQILAGSSRAAVDDFIQRQPNRNDLSVFTANRNGKTLYIVVMGSFGTSDDARLAVDTLPREQRSAGPWPRSFQSVQADIREFRGF